MRYKENLREALSRITKLTIPSEFQQAYEEVKEKFGHTIIIINQNSSYLCGFNCFAYALGIHEDSKFKELVEQNRFSKSTVANSDFVLNLIGKNILQEVKKPAANDIALYYDYDQKLCHAGILLNDSRIRSKWGADELCEHGLLEVPSFYGETIKFYRVIESGKILNELEIFTTTNQ